MEKWINKVALVTGASSGIGAVIALSLADAGMLVVGLGRRIEKIEVLIILNHKICNFILIKIFSRNYQQKLQEMVKFFQKNVTLQMKVKWMKFSNGLMKI